MQDTYDGLEYHGNLAAQVPPKITKALAAAVVLALLDLLAIIKSHHRRCCGCHPLRTMD